MAQLVQRRELNWKFVSMLISLVIRPNERTSDMKDATKDQQKVFEVNCYWQEDSSKKC